MSSLRDDTDPVLRNLATDDVIQEHDEFDNSAEGSVFTEINDSCTVDWKNLFRTVTLELKK